MKEQYFNPNLYSDDLNSHMHLCEGNIVKAAIVYREHRGGRCNFAELKSVVTAEPGHGLEKHLIRNSKDHLGNMRYSYILFQAHKQMVPAFEKTNFFPIEYDRLPADVKERMPYKEGSVCMKFLLPKWQSNRYDLVQMPTGYPASVTGNLMRDKLKNVRGGYGKIFLEEYVEHW